MQNIKEHPDTLEQVQTCLERFEAGPAVRAFICKAAYSAGCHPVCEHLLYVRIPGSQSFSNVCSLSQMPCRIHMDSFVLIAIITIMSEDYMIAPRILSLQRSLHYIYTTTLLTPDIFV